MRAHHRPPPRPAPRTSPRLERLYDIGRTLLAPFPSVEAMVTAVLRVAARAIPLRGVVLVESPDSGPRVISWLAAGRDPESAAASARRALLAFARATGRVAAAEVVPLEAALPGAAPGGAPVAPVVMPLALRGRPCFGILQIEPARPLEQADLAYLDNAANCLAIALDRLYGRLRETALLHQAEQAEKEARRVSEQLERLVAERALRLDQTIKDMHSFAYSIAHDLRAPLRHIHGYSEFLVERADPDCRAHAVRIMAAARRMDALIEDLLTYSRLTLEDVAVAPLAPSPLLERVLQGLGADIRSREARLEVESPLPRVMAHPVPLTQILSNLLSNALKFSAPGVAPVIRVSSEIRGERARIVVEDNGIGVEPAYREKIFELFQRLHKSERYPGTGIGLALVRRAAERMGGSVGVEAAAGPGSRFWVELKCAD